MKNTKWTQLGPLFLCSLYSCMDLKGFKKAVTKSVVKNVIVGTGIFLFGVFIVWLVVSGADPESKDMTMAGKIVIWVLAGLCLFFGFFITFMHLKNHFKVQRGDHPIIKAIENGDNGHLVWIYENITRVEGGGSDHQLWTFDRNGKQFILSVKAKRVQEVMAYLKEQFPSAVLGYTKEIEEQMNAYFKEQEVV